MTAMPIHTRWTKARKEEVIDLIREGKVDRAEFMRLNRVSEEEMEAWEAGPLKIKDAYRRHRR